MNVHDDAGRYETELVDALERLERGESIESILRRHPDAAGALRPALETASALAGAVREPTAHQAAASRDRLLAAFDARGADSRTGTAARRAGREAARATPRASTQETSPSSVASILRRLRPSADRQGSGVEARRPTRGLKTAWAMAASVSALMVSASVAQAASQALPGDALYAVKEVGRDALVASALRPEDRRDRAEAVSASRRSDVALAMLDARTADIEFEGVIDAYADTWCEVSGLLVNVPPDVAEYGEAEHPGAFKVGDHVLVRARLSAGMLVATEMVPYLDYGLPAPPADHAPSDPTRTAVATVSPSPSPSPSSSPTTAPPTAPAGDPAVAPPLIPPPAPPASGSGSEADARDDDDDRDRDDDDDRGGDDDDDDDRGGDDDDDRGGGDDDDDDRGGDDDDDDD